MEILSKQDLQRIKSALEKSSLWLNGGECCGEKDSDETCCAPACSFGDKLSALHKAADIIEEELRHGN